MSDSATQAFFSGKGASYGLAGTDYKGNDGWQVDDNPTELRTDNTAGQGCSDRIIGSKDCVVTLEQNFDASANPFDTPYGFKTGTLLTNLKLYLNGPGTPFWLLPSAIVLSNSNVAKTNQKVTVTTKIGNKGTFTYPTGTWTPS
jgi:hypothetical protein